MKIENTHNHRPRACKMCVLVSITYVLIATGLGHHLANCCGANKAALAANIAYKINSRSDRWSCWSRGVVVRKGNCTIHHES